MNNENKTSTWRFPRIFWFANAMELCERAAYYGFFIVITLYLSSIVGFSDIEAGFIAGTFAGLLYFLPPFMGIVSDKIGFRKAMLLAFALLTIGYGLLGYGESKVAVCLFLVILLIGSSFIKPLITGTVAKASDEHNRARAFSLFYWVVNIGAFLGKTFVPYIRQEMGLAYVNFFSASVSFVAFLIALFFYFPPEEVTERKTYQELFRGLWSILSNVRLMILTLIIAGFWTVQQQLYATMPKYVIRTVGEDARPEWIANVNPFVVVLCVVFVTQIMKKRRAINSMLTGMFIMPISAFALSLGPWLQSKTGPEVVFFSSETFGTLSLHPITVMLVVGIAFQGLAECFISPRFLEYFSLQAPKNEEGLYLGFSHLHSFFSIITGFFVSGFLLEKYCPDPATLPKGLSPEEFAAYYAQANHMWYYFVAIALASAFLLFIFKIVTDRIDAKNGKTPE